MRRLGGIASQACAPRFVRSRLFSMHAIACSPGGARGFVAAPAGGVSSMSASARGLERALPLAGIRATAGNAAAASSASINRSSGSTRDNSRRSCPRRGPSIERSDRTASRITLSARGKRYARSPTPVRGHRRSDGPRTKLRRKRTPEVVSARWGPELPRTRPPTEYLGHSKSRQLSWPDRRPPAAAQA